MEIRNTLAHGSPREVAAFVALARPKDLEILWSIDRRFDPQNAALFVV
jgi:hypothetical protein